MNDGLEINASYKCVSLPHTEFVCRRCGCQPHSGKWDGGTQCGLKMSLQPTFPWNYHLEFIFLLCCWCTIFPADVPLFLSSPSLYFNILFVLFLPLIVHLQHLFHSPLKENPPVEALSLLTSLAKITSRVPTTWSTARPNVTTSATHSTTSFWIPHTLFSLPALSRSEMFLRCQRAGNVPSFHCKLGEFWDR